MQTKSKHIVIVTSEFPPQPGGIGNHAYHLALNLFRNNYKVTVITDQREFLNTSETIFDSNLPFLVKRIRMRKLRVFMYFNRIIKTIQTLINSDIVIATGKFSLWNVAFCNIFVKRLNLAVIHGTEVNFKSPVVKSLINKSLKRFDTIVAVSNYTKQFITHLKKNIEVIPNGIDTSAWLRNKTSLQLKGSPVLTTVGRVSVRKGQLQVIRMLPNLLKFYPDAHYHCIGLLGSVEDCKKEAKALDVESHVTFHGVLNIEDLKSMLGVTDVFVMLSQESSSGDIEGFGIAILEANAMGVPAIGSINCGIEDAIEDGVTGFLVDSSTPKAFQESVSEILEDKQVFKNNALVWAKQHDWNSIIKQYIALLS